MDVVLLVVRESDVHHIRDPGDVDTTSSHVCADEESYLSVLWDREGGREGGSEGGRKERGRGKLKKRKDRGG